MRNGVEVIVATDRNLRPVEPEYLRHLSSTVTRPITLAPHTLTNLMSMVLFTEQVADGQSHLMSVLQPSFVTKTFYTTLSYPTTILKNSSSTVTNLQTVITNIKTEQYSKTKSSEDIEPTTITLNASPTLQTEVFQTAYTYLNTFLDGDQPFVMSSTQTLSNTLVGNYGSFNDLEPSEVYPTTNTYHKTVEFTKTLTDGTDFQIISTKDVVTQVIVTDRPDKKATNVPITTEVTKTYFVTYTYFSTYTDGDKTKVKSDVSVSSDVTIEKFYIKPKKTETKIESTKAEIPVKLSSAVFPFTILAARPYQTTFTYFTTLLQGPNSDKAETKIISRTKVVENTITETISLNDFNTDYLIRLNSSLNKITGSLVTTATLKRGEKIVVTAHRNPSLNSSYQKYDIKPTKTTTITETKTELLQEKKEEPSKVKTTFSKSSSVHFKSKNTILSKSKIKSTKTVINEATAEALVDVKKESSSEKVTPTVTLTPVLPISMTQNPTVTSESITTTPTPTSTVKVQKATVSSSEQIVKHQDEESSEITEADSNKKKPGLKQPTAPMNVTNLLNLNSLGINGMNVLGPVFNAMAELIHNNLNKNSDSMTRRNDTVPVKEAEQSTKKPSSSNLNPLLSLVNKFTPAVKDAEPKVKVTTPRTPVYIPVGSFAKDSEFSESQDSLVVKGPETWHEKWTDTHAKNFEKGRPHDTPITILEGGIPISPGQVITTNSDVIIGRPGESGPRPPTFAVKNNIPVGMKPPPLPPHVLVDGEEEDGYIGQHSTNQGIDSDFSKEEYNVIPPRPPTIPPKNRPLDNHKQIRPNPSDRFKSSVHHKNPQFGKHSQGDYDSGIMDLNPPPVPPAIRTQDVHRPLTINHQQNEDVPYNPPTYQIPLHLGPNQNVANYINPAEISPAVVGVPNIPLIQENVPVNEPTPALDINPNGVLLIPTIAHIPLNLAAALTQQSNLVDRSTGHQLLVNIQPSQVANIVIPHGSSTALILSEEKQHSLKGEVIDDPSPHPEPETVGFVGAEPVLKIENDDIVPTVHNNVITAGAELTKQSAHDNRGISGRPLLTTEHIKIRPKPAFNDVKVQEPYSVHSASEQHSLIFGHHKPGSSGLQSGYQSNSFTVGSGQHQPSALNVNTGQQSGSFSVTTGKHQLGSSANSGQPQLGSFAIGSEQHPTGPFSITSGQQQSASFDVTSGHLSNFAITPGQHQSTPFGATGGQHHLDSFSGTKGHQNAVFADNHRKPENNYRGDISGNLNFESQKVLKDPETLHFHQGHSTSTSSTKQVFFNQNYRKEGPKIGSNYFHQEKVSSGGQHIGLIKSHHKVHNHIVNEGLSADQKKIIRGPNLVKGESGIYVDISPPGHLPPPQVNHLHQGMSSIKHQSVVNEHLSNHQSGHVHDVPLNAQVQLGSGMKKENPLKEILISANTNKHDSVFDAKERPETMRRPLPELPENLSPPPLPKDGNHRPVRPHPFKPHQTQSQRYPPHSHPNVPKPSEFMIPPPQISQISHRPNQKPHADHQPRPVIPIGAGAPQQNYPNPRPDEILIVPHKNRPGSSATKFEDNLTHEVHKHTSSIYSDLDVSDTSDPFKTEYGEEIQESISRPLFPGQLPAELQESTTTHNNIPSNHKPKPITEVTQTTKYKDDQPVLKPASQDHENLTNHKPKIPGGTDSNKQTPNSSFFSLIKKPSGFVTTNKNDVRKESTNYPNHKESAQTSYHKEQGGFEAFKVPPGDIDKGKVPSNTNKLHIQAVGPSVIPSGFVKNENTPDHIKQTNYAIAQQETEETVQESVQYIKGGTNRTRIDGFSEGTKKTNNVSVFGFKNKTPNEQPKIKTSTQKITTQHVEVTTQGQKLPGRHDTQNVHVLRPPSVQPQKPTGAGQLSRPQIQESTGAGTIKFDSNKISIGYPSLTNVGLYNGANKPGRYPAADGPLKPSTRPSGFTNKKEEAKVPGGSTNVVQSSGIDAKPSQKPSGVKDIIHSSGSVKVPSGFATKNETDHLFGIKSNHNYGNKTVHFYEPKPTFDVDEEGDVTYKEPGTDVDKWFSSNFGGSNSGSDVKITSPNKPTSTHRNVSSVPHMVSPSGSDVQITLLTPPKVEDIKTKPEDVMGLSPPPLERPRRPQKPQRPKPPYKFEISTTPKSTLPPIAIENDFPPVRSPDFNRKPLKPQDIFPPRLPDNFIHHLPEYPIRNHPKPRPERPSTSMPIDIKPDVPENANTEKNIYHDFEETGSRDTFFAGSEINGHSKPIFDNESILGTMRPPPPPPPPSTITRPKPVPKPSTIYQQPPKIRTTERVKPQTTSKPQPTVTIERDEISSTSTIIPTRTTTHTYIGATVKPTSAQPPVEWEEQDVITGSETIFDPDLFSTRVTPAIQDTTSKRNFVTTLISTGSTTIFGDLFTTGVKHKTDNSKVVTEKEKPQPAQEETERIAPSKTVVPNYTTTLTVTTTMTTVVHSVGHKPSTKTIVLTKTLISTVFNKITETKTLVKPTTATIIQTHTIATTKTALVVSTALYPTQTKHTPGGTLKSEIFMADPHDDKDTMTISVSSSMNKHKNGEEKSPVGARPDKNIVVLVSNKHPDVLDEDSRGVINDDENGINDSRIVVGGVFDANEEKGYKEGSKEIECSPKCQPKKNELCQRVEGVMKCVCRPGFARMFPDRPCRPTYTYNVQLMLEKLDNRQITQEKNFAQSGSPNMAKLASATKEGLDRMIMQSDLRDIYHGVMLNGFQGKDKKTMVDFYVQLSENTDETKLTNILKKTLKTSNYSLGGTELFAAKGAGSLQAEDFNECLSPKFHDCSENARCFNLKGTYTCSCKEGYTDLSENSQFPGRICSDTIGCEYCGYHGACYSKGEGQITCECFQWYSGERCHINLKVLLIALVTIGAILLALLLVCSVLTCLNRRSKHSSASRTNGSSAGYLRYRGPSSQSLDRRAMIGDSSSESSVDNLPYICSPPIPATGTMSGKKKPVLRRTKGPAPRPAQPPGMEQRDRSVTVMIPRAKYRPVPPLSPHLTMSTFSPDKHLSKTAAQIANEQKLINYLDGNTREERSHSSTNNRQVKELHKNNEFKAPSNDSPRPVEKKKESKVFEYEYKMSNMIFTEETNSMDKKSFKSLDDRFRRHSDSTHIHSDNSNKNQFRKYSAGALVSAGYEVSAKVGMHHLEEDTEDEHSGIMNTHTMKSNRSQFTTLNRTGDHKTMSEARSYDETTVHPQTRSLKTHYSGSSPSSRVNNDEGHTMIERDLGSTFIMPESHLFKPEADRGSDISNFDSL